jgi:glucose-1-phosphatase
MVGDETIALELYKKHYLLFDNYEKGDIIMENFLWNLQKMCKEVPEVSDLLSAWNAMLLGWNDSKLSLLKDLKSTYNLYLLSNTNEIHLNWVRRDLKRNHQIIDFEKLFFIKAYYSHELRMRKPDAEIFDFVIADAGIKAEETLFIDDNADNIKAARALGFYVHHLPTNSAIDIDQIISMLP